MFVEKSRVVIIFLKMVDEIPQHIKFASLVKLAAGPGNESRVLDNNILQIVWQHVGNIFANTFVIIMIIHFFINVF